MARTLTFQFNGADFPCSPEKVDRSKLYGYIDVETLDPKERKCQLATLADDGRTIVGIGGTSFGYLAPDGEWLEKRKLKPVDSNGNPIVPVASTYSAPVPLKTTATIEDYLSHNIKGVYLLHTDAEHDLTPLAAELKKGTIYKFDYSFRGGLEYDIGFLLASQDGAIFMCVGQPTSIHFVGLEQIIVPEDDTGEEGESDAMDFGMM